MKLLRVFFIHHRLREKTYEKKRLRIDFPEHTNIESAYGTIYSRYGTLKGWDGPKDESLGDAKAPFSFASIHSHTWVDPEKEPATVDEWEAVQLELFES